MKARLLWSLPFLVLFLATGCETVDTRIQKKPEAFARIDKVTQEKIKQGIIGLGYTEDMVYLAIGKPDQIRESVTATTHTLAWIYNSYTSHYDSAFMMSYHSGPFFYPYAYRPYGYYYPPYLDAYHTEVEERIRVTFSEGKVTGIDQLKD